MPTMSSRGWPRTAGVIGVALVLSACATVHDPAPHKPQLEQALVSPYGLFLAGRGALSEGRGAEAAALFERARITGDDEQGVLSDRLFAATLMAGDVMKAARLAPQGPAASDFDKQLGRLVKAVDAMAGDEPKAALPIFAEQSAVSIHRAATVLMTPWAAAMAGDLEMSLARPQGRGERIVDYFGMLGQAFLFEHAKRFDEAETDFKALAGNQAADELIALAYGGFLERRGRRADAVALYDRSLSGAPRDAALQAARTRALDPRAAPPPRPTLKQGAAQALLAPAAIMMNAKHQEIGLIYLRLALRLDPNFNGAWLGVGDLLLGAGDVDGARAAFAKPKPGSPEYGAARAKLAWSYQSGKDGETALKLARETAASGDLDAKVTLADLLRANEKYAESAVVLTDLIGPNPDWRLLYARGISLDRSGQWKAGETDLTAALAQRPDDAEILNYLGYSWIDRGEHLAEALAMVQKAVGQNPNSGAMVDSLGWAYYRLGDFKMAQQTLEHAIELEAGDPDINNHLGDAYWRVGRKDEAGFQWRRVLTLDPEPKLKAEVEGKIAHGLDAAPTPVATKIAER